MSEERPEGARVYDRLVGVDSEGRLPPVVAAQLKGDPGAPGEPGEPGSPGPAGVSVESVERAGGDTEAKAVFRLSDESTHEVVLPRGPQGAKGDPGGPGKPGEPGEAGTNGVGVARVERAGSDAAAHAVFHLTDESTHEVALPRGPQGDPGPVGPIGPAGDRGPAGPVGPAAAVGVQDNGDGTVTIG